MKFIYKILIVAFLLGATNACDDTELDLLQDPNQITPEKASVNDLYNNIQLQFRNVYNQAQFIPGAVTRMYYAFGFRYTENSDDDTFSGQGGLWDNVYARLFPDIDALIDISNAVEVGGGAAFSIHTGSARIMKAYTLMVLVDLLGDVPYSYVEPYPSTNPALGDAGQGTDVISPMPSPGAEVYAAAIKLLDDAIAGLTGTTAGPPAFDNFYGGDPDKWITAAKTMKLRAALNMGDVAMINSLVSAGDLIDAVDGSEDFQFNYGNQQTITTSGFNSRHPLYNNNYEAGDGNYMSNYYMWLLRVGKTNAAGVSIIDPRRRYYFYRKVKDAFGLGSTSYACHYTTLPSIDPGQDIAHFDVVDPNLPFCVVTEGYYGRDHLNGEGIPPDGPFRTSWGLYPMGGDFDDDSFEDTRTFGVKGGLGAGILPIMLSSFTDFMVAEAVLRLGATGDARALLQSGIQKSMDKVISFESLVLAKMGTTVTLKDGSSGTIKDLFGTDQAAIDFFSGEILTLYDAASASGKLDILTKEFYTAAWGNGLEAYNMYRRTGFPSNLQPGLNVNAGTGSDPFPLSFMYPSDHVTRNANVDQKDGLGVPVFWPSAPGLY